LQQHFLTNNDEEFNHSYGRTLSQISGKVEHCMHHASRFRMIKIGKTVLLLFRKEEKCREMKDTDR
jgi:hypothetical protein